MPQRIQMSRQHPWRADHPDAVIVGRPGKWGNPWTARSEAIWQDDGKGTLRMIPAPRASLVRIFREHLVGVLAEYAGTDLGLPFTADEVRRELAGKDLACWCAVDGPCHADVLLEVANSWAAQGGKPA